MPLLIKLNSLLGVYELWGSFLVAMATVVKVTKVWIFFSLFGPTADLHAKSREDRTVNTRENMRPSFALYIYDIAHETCEIILYNSLSVDTHSPWKSDKYKLRNWTNDLAVQRWTMESHDTSVHLNGQILTQIEIEHHPIIMFIIIFFTGRGSSHHFFWSPLCLHKKILAPRLWL